MEYFEQKALSTATHPPPGSGTGLWMTPLSSNDVMFSGVLDPILLIRSTLVPHLTLGSNCQGR